MKAEKELRQVAIDAGLTVVDLGHTRGDHLYIIARNSSGVVKKFFFSATPSDWRAILNKRALLRKFAAGRL